MIKTVSEMRYLFMYKCVIFLLCIVSMYPWFTHGLTSIYFALSGAILSLLFFFSNKKKLIFKKVQIKVSASFLAVFLIWNALHGTIFGFLEIFLTGIILYVIVGLNISIKKELLQTITRWFSVFITCSLAIYCLWLFGISLPKGIAFPSSPYEGDNYYMFVIDYVFYGVPRFKSIFAEPGHLTMGLIPLIAANRFDIRNKYVLLLIIAELFTISLAGYICLLTGLLLKMFFSNTNRVRTVLTSMILLAGVVLFYNYSKNNDLQLYYSIFERLENYSNIEDTAQMGDRFKDNTIKAYNKVMNSNDRYWGIGFTEKSLEATSGSSGYKVYVIYYGIIGVFLMFLFYWRYYFENKSHDAFALFLCCSLLLIQNAYPLWYIFVIIFILGCPLLKLKNENSSISPCK